MATVPSEITYTAGTVLTAAQLNTNLRDSVNFLLAPPACVLLQAVAQSIPNNTPTALTYDTELLDNDGMHSTTANTSRMTAQTGGWFMYGGGVSQAASGTGFRLARWTLNGAVTNGSAHCVAGNANGPNGIPARTMISYLNAGDYLELQYDQSSGGTVTLLVGAEEAASAWARWMSTS